MRSIRFRFAMLLIAIDGVGRCLPLPLPPSCLPDRLPVVPRRTISLASRVRHQRMGESRGSGDGVAGARSERLVDRGDQLL